MLLELRGAQPGAVFTIPASGIVIGRSSVADVSLSDSSISNEHAKVVLDGGPFIYDLASEHGTFVNDQRIKQRTPLCDGDYVRVGHDIIFKFSMVDEFEEQAHRALFELTLRDPLTHLYNRQYFDERLHREFTFAQRHDTPLGLLLIDIDHFKPINDTWGHQVGDAVLKRFALSIQEMMRPEDVVARYGGDEFVIIVRATSRGRLERLATRLCDQVRVLPIDPDLGFFPVTVSIGVSCLNVDAPYVSPRALLLAADDALYAAKAAGRNTVSSCPPPAVPEETPFPLINRRNR